MELRRETTGYRILGRNIMETLRFSLIVNTDFPIKFTLCSFLKHRSVKENKWEFINFVIPIPMTVKM